MSNLCISKMLENINKLLRKTIPSTELKDVISFTTLTSFYIIINEQKHSVLYHYTLPYDPIIIHQFNFRVDKMFIRDNFLYCKGQNIYQKMDLKTTIVQQLYKCEYLTTNFTISGTSIKNILTNQIIYQFDNDDIINVFEQEVSLAVQTKDQIIFYAKTKSNLYLRQILQIKGECFQYQNLICIFGDSFLVYQGFEFQRKIDLNFSNIIQIGNQFYCSHNADLYQIIIGNNFKIIVRNLKINIKSNIYLSNGILQFSKLRNMDIVDQLLITKQDLGQNMKGLQSDLKFNDRKQEHQSAIQLEILIKKLQHILKGDYLSSNNNIIDTQLLFQDTVKNVQECQKTFQVVDNNIKVSSNIQQLYQKLNNYPIKISKQTQKQEVQLTQQILRIYDLFEQVEKMRQKIFIDEQQFSPEIILEDFDEIKLMESSVHNQE